jgi:hypothetical protein
MNKYVVSYEVNKLNVIGVQIESIYEMDINLNNSIFSSLITGKITQFKNAMLTECTNPVLFCTLSEINPADNPQEFIIPILVCFSRKIKAHI